MVDSLTSSHLISNSQLLIPTLGIGTVYEGIGASTPVLLLPPNNSTQLQQYRVFDDVGFSHILEKCSSLQKLYEIEIFPWEKQTILCLELLKQVENIDSLLEKSIIKINNKIQKNDTKELLSLQNDLFSKISHQDLYEILFKLVK